MKVWEKMRGIRLPWWATLLVGAVLGALVILAIRYATYSPAQVHYHANMAVYINGKREEFRGPQYYQEVAICGSTDDIHLPQQRAHMHDNINSVVHVHDHAVTWGQFFENMGWYIGPDLIETNDGAKYIANDTDKLHIIINGQDYTDLTPITNRVIGDKDRLLVSFGNINEQTLQQQYKSVPSTAAHYDNTKDPASCAGSEKITPSKRLHHLF